MTQNKQLPPKKVSKAKRQTWRERLSVSSFSGRGELRHSNNVKTLLIFMLGFIILWQDCNYRSGYYDIAQNQWMVIHEKPNGEILVRETKDFKSDADKITAQNLAINVVKTVAEMGTNNIDESESKLKTLFTDEAGKKMQEAVQKQREDFKELKESRGIGIYRKITPEGISVRDISVKDFPPGAKPSLSGLDVAAYGKVITYDAATNMEITRENFFFWIKLSQLEERTVANPWGLLVSSLTQLNPNESAGFIEQQQAEAEKEKMRESDRLMPKRENSANSNTNTNTQGK